MLSIRKDLGGTFAKTVLGGPLAKEVLLGGTFVRSL